MEGRLAGFVAKTIEVIVRLAQSHRELQEMAQGIVKEERVLCVCVLFSGQPTCKAMPFHEVQFQYYSLISLVMNDGIEFAQVDQPVCLLSEHSGLALCTCMVFSFESITDSHW